MRCPVGKVVLGGGGQAFPSLEASIPVDDVPSHNLGPGWIVVMGGTSPGNETVRVYAICANAQS